MHIKFKKEYDAIGVKTNKLMDKIKKPKIS
jgi:hypothetical protein